jgi:hypothetical protein
MGTEICIYKNKLFIDASFLHILGMPLSFRYFSISNTYMMQITLTKQKCLRKRERKKKRGIKIV